MNKIGFPLALRLPPIIPIVLALPALETNIAFHPFSQVSPKGRAEEEEADQGQSNSSLERRSSVPLLHPLRQRLPICGSASSSASSLSI